MANEKCVSDAIDNSLLSKEEALDIYEEMLEEIDFKIKNGIEESRAFKEVVEELNLRDLNEARNTIHNGVASILSQNNIDDLRQRRVVAEILKIDVKIKARKKLGKSTEKLEAQKEKVRKRGGSRYDVISDMLAGSERPAFGSSNSVDVKSKALWSVMFRKIQVEFEKLDINAEMKKGVLDADIIEESRHGLKKSITGNEKAFEAAKVIKKHSDDLRKELIEVGATVGEIDNYLTKMMHDPYAIRKAGFAKWNDLMLRVIDHEKVFKNVKDQDKFMKDAYNQITSGKDMLIDTYIPNKVTDKFKSKVEGHKVFHFIKDGEYEYRQNFGKNNTIIADLIDVTTFDTKAVEMMRKFGPDWKKTINDAMALEQEKLRVIGNAKDLDKFRKEQIKLQNLIDHFDGTANMPVYGTMSNIFSFYRQFKNMNLLGNILFSAFPDLAIMPLTLRHQGVNIGSSVKKSFIDSYGKIARQDRKLFTHMEFADMEYVMGQTMSRFAGFGDMMDKKGALNSLGRASNFFFKLTGIQGWNKHHKERFIHILTSYAGAMKDIEYKNLNVDFLRTLGKYEIDADGWDFLRTYGAIQSPGNKDIYYVSSRNIDKIPDEVIAQKFFSNETNAAKLRLKIDRYKSKLISDYNAYLIDSTDHAIVTPGLKQRAYAFGATKPGTISGELARSFWHLKTFPLTLTQKVIMRSFVGGKQGRLNIAGADIEGLMLGIIMATSMGYLANAITDLSKLRTPKDMIDHPVPTLMDAIRRGGGGGLFADFVFALENKYGGTVLESIGGVAAGDAVKLGHVFSNILEGKFDKAGGKVLKETMKNVPFSNLFYTKAAYDFLLLDRMNEWLNPGYKRRIETNMKKEYGQEFIF
ncbi:MAG: hypothetical protein ACTSQ0_03010 [Candidatus Heimdallarchaeota archaeon]